MDYRKLITSLISEWEDLSRQRDEIDLKLAKVFQLLKAALPMLPEEDRERLQEASPRLQSQMMGLTGAIRIILKSSPDKKFSPTMIRDELKRAGWDFSAYTTNPLASIHAILKRFSGEDVEVTHIDGATAYQWKKQRWLTDEPVPF